MGFPLWILNFDESVTEAPEFTGVGRELSWPKIMKLHFGIYSFLFIRFLLGLG